MICFGSSQVLGLGVQGADSQTLEDVRVTIAAPSRHHVLKLEETSRRPSMGSDYTQVVRLFTSELLGPKDDQLETDAGSCVLHAVCVTEPWRRRRQPRVCVIRVSPCE